MRSHSACNSIHSYCFFSKQFVFTKLARAYPVYYDIANKKQFDLRSLSACNSIHSNCFISKQFVFAKLARAKLLYYDIANKKQFDLRSLSACNSIHSDSFISKLFNCYNKLEQIFSIVTMQIRSNSI